MELYGIPVRVLTLEGLIAVKRATGRPRDREHLLELEALLELRERASNDE
jgi:predicted nucleotidyltransferase